MIVGGWAYGNYENIVVDGLDKAQSYVKHTGGGDGRYVAGIVGHADEVSGYTNCTVKNITISGGWLCGGIAGPVGMLLGVPLASTIYRLFKEATTKRELANKETENDAKPEQIDKRY